MWAGRTSLINLSRRHDDRESTGKVYQRGSSCPQRSSGGTVSGSDSFGFFGSLKLVHLTSQEVAKYRDARLKEVSPASLKRELTILSRVLTIASRDWGISIPQNPVSMISLPKADKARTRRLEAGEKERLLQSANPELHRIIVLALETAMRRGEILNIKKSHINFCSYLHCF